MGKQTWQEARSWLQTCVLLVIVGQLQCWLPSLHSTLLEIQQGHGLPVHESDSEITHSSAPEYGPTQTEPSSDLHTAGPSASTSFPSTQAEEPEGGTPGAAPPHINTRTPAPTSKADRGDLDDRVSSAESPSAEQALALRRTQKSALCHAGTEMQEMLSVCCVDGNGHYRRRSQTQSGCDSLPNVCPASCAPAFLSFYASCPSLAAQIEGSVAFRDRCAAVADPAPVPPPPLPPPPPPHGTECADSARWRGAKGQGCAQYALDAESSWRSTCHVDVAADISDLAAESTAMFGLTVETGTAAEACPVTPVPFAQLPRLPQRAQ
eukprot:SAG11_NODE_6334_length_1334_cov_1.404858_1_plen_322_part_00